MVRRVARVSMLVLAIAAPAAAAAQERRGPDMRAPATGDFGPFSSPFAMRSSVAGPYVAGGLGYGATSTRSFTVTDSVACPSTSIPGYGQVAVDGVSGCSTSARLSGLSGHLIAGWNFSGDQAWVSGAEFRGRLGSETGSGRLGGATQVSLAGIASYVNQAQGAYQAELDAGLAVSARFGYNLSGFLPFVRVGVGAARLTETSRFDATNARYCTTSLTCTTGGNIASAKTSWLPSAVFGAGLEIPYGRFFARVDGELEAVFSGSSNLTSTVTEQALVTAAGQPTGQTVSTIGSAALKSENWIIARRVMLSGGFRF